MHRPSQNKRRRNPQGFEWHNGDQPPPTARMRHTNISLDAEGPRTLNTTLLPAPVSPPPPPPATHSETVYRDDYLLTQLFNQADVEMDVVTGLEEGEMDGAEDEDGDPQYQRFLEDNELGTGKPRKKRTVTVRTLLFCTGNAYSPVTF